jgi:uncharacterized protein (TIGR02996 family)
VTDGDSLLQAILANPGDTIARMVYADWLDEAGEVERAALIRIQIDRIHSRTHELTQREQQLLGPIGDRVRQRRREWALPAALRESWPDDLGGWEWHRGFPEVWHCPLALWMAHGAALTAVQPIRRVVVTDREPRPSLTNPRKPERTWFRDEGNWEGGPAPENLLPAKIFDHLEYDPFDFSMFDHSRVYRSRAEAVRELSDACLRYASGARAFAGAM